MIRPAGAGLLVCGSPTAWRVELRGVGEGAAGGERVAQARDDVGRGGGGRLVCARCGNPIASTVDRIRVGGSWIHTFANPHGYVYRIECYGCAQGIALAGAQSTDFTWFAGYAWQVALCARCGAHLGWQFRSPEHAFAGLIASMLIERPPDGV
jgi:hypothetical protein